MGGLAQDEGDGFGRVFWQDVAGEDGRPGGRGGLAGFGRAGIVLVRVWTGGGLGGGMAVVRAGIVRVGIVRAWAGRAGGAPCGAAWGGGSGVELGDVGGGAALPGAAAGQGCEAEVA
ncbi:MAG TPA: hypothetical protein VGC15_07270, partial [Acetobacteraceae bacterium]